MQKNKNDVLTMGFALFAMFFGAGNLLLPPMLGIQTGEYYLITALAFSLTGILLPFCGVLAIVQSGDNFNDLGNRIHPWLAPIMGSVIMLCIGPFIAIPRTAATTFEVGLLPVFPNFSPVISSIIFFSLTWALTIVPSKVVDIVGNILTPALLVLLILLIGVGVFKPVGEIASSALTSSQAFTLGFTEGYQTLDVLASVIFAGIIISAANAKGYNEVQAKRSVVIRAGVLSALCLLIIYGGLMYLGAVSGISDSSISRSALLIHVAQTNLGSLGMFGIGLSIALACLTTAIALTAAVGSFFSQISGGKLSYKLLVTICCALSGVLAVSGVDNIINFAYPPLAFLYPIVITLIVYIVFFGGRIHSRTPYIGALIGSTIAAVLNLSKMLGWTSEATNAILSKLPLFDLDLGWVLPSVIGFVIGLLISRGQAK